SSFLSFFSSLSLSLTRLLFFSFFIFLSQKTYIFLILFSVSTRYEQDHGSSRKISNLNQPKSSFESKDNSNKMNEHQAHSHLDEESDTDQETDRLLGAQRVEEKNNFDEKNNGYIRKKNSPRETLIEGVLFRARYLGSTQLICNGQPTKATRMMQAEEAVSRIKAPDGESQPSTEVDLFISTEKIMVLNTDLKEIMMDHALRTISYIADIGDLLVLMTRRRVVNPSDDSNDHKMKRIPRMICHVFESEEAQFIAQSIGQAFQVAYMEFLKANGIEDSSFVKEMDYQEVLNSQEIFGNELEMFAKKDRQKEIIIPKQKGEILGIVIVESGWGSMLPTVVIANMTPQGPAARCGQINIGDQIIAINGISLVGLPLSTCQSYIKNTKNQTAVKMTLVPCAPVVEVKIKRPDTKYQLGFSVQNGVICSLLRGGIAERGGVRVGHRIIEINGQSVVAVPHERIVNLLATSVGEIAMKTMPTSMYRLLTGQESPAYI
ncbi:protein lin-10-like, partial [Panonychus citri]|uniref:protein lin-10-like n=1 Tax=Panonychus citri TaxID=50023 RepID=UPI002307BB3D